MFVSPRMGKRDLDSRARVLLRKDDSDDEFSIGKVQPAKPLITRNRNSVGNFQTERRSLFQSKANLIPSPRLDPTPEKLWNGAKARDQNEILLENTLKKLKKEKKSLKEVTEQIKQKELASSQAVETLTRQVKKLKENEAVLVKELMQQQNTFQQTIDENQRQMQRYATEVKEMQYQYENELMSSKKKISQLENALAILKKQNSKLADKDDALDHLELLLKDKDNQLMEFKSELTRASNMIERLQTTNSSLKEELQNLESKVYANIKDNDAIDSLKKDAEIKDKMIAKLKQEVELLETNSKTKQSGCSQKEADLQQEVERLNREVKRYKEESKGAYTKELEIKHLTAQLKAKDTEITSIKDKYRKKLKKKRKQMETQEEQWKRQYNNISKDLQELKVEIGVTKRDNSRLLDQNRMLENINELEKKTGLRRGAQSMDYTEKFRSVTAADTNNYYFSPKSSIASQH